MRGFTLIELIFVIIIMGILTFVGLRFIPKDVALSDKQVLKELLLQKRANALGFEANMSNESERNLVCINLNRDDINSEENSSRVKYFFKSTIKAVDEDNNVINTICFDEYGRVFKNKVDDNLSNLLHKNVIITLSAQNKEKNITIYKFTGDIE